MNLYDFIVKNRENYENILKSNSHALIIESKDEIFLDVFAKYFVLNLFCKNETPCFTCGDCLKVLNNNSLDMFIYDKPIMVDNAKEIIDNLYVVPAENEYKVFIIKNFDKVSERVQNKLLKSIEEPPKFVKFILLTSNIESILPTVRSRCEKYELPLLTKQQISELIESDNEKLKVCAIENSNNSYGQAKEYLENKDFMNVFSLVFDMFKNMMKSSDSLKYFSKINKYKDNFSMFIKLLEKVMFDVLKFNSGDKNLIDNQSHLSEIKQIAFSYSSLACVKILDYIDGINENLQFNANFNLQIDTLLLYILEVKFKCKK